MHNSRILTNEFEFFQPADLSELFDLVSDTGVETQLMAGGTDVLPQMKEGRKSPQRLISTMKVKELDFVTLEGNYITIGATAKLKAIAAFCKDIPSVDALYDGVSAVGKIQILNMATIAGNICTASPAADPVPPMLAMDASLTLQSRNSQRDIALKDFLLGPGRTALRPEEIVYKVNIPMPQSGTGSEFKKLERVSADIAKINMAVVVIRKGNICQSCKVAVGSCGPTTLLLSGPDKILGGKEITDLEGELIREAGASVSDEITPIDDIRSSAEYRRKVASVIFMDSFKVAWARAEGEAL
ncbi:MAG: xanthine dehydrogenase family protein subunit M [Proteobacteria bacterium]|nr:xanthine dehydrogenase family protein subunit M [Pseudomonadota bacterium]MBU1057515.1 xanthine dehydrogenase family protein subunit M [Pseudomonadota bacterium]